jgi:hypothetical protein
VCAHTLANNATCFQFLGRHYAADLNKLVGGLPYSMTCQTHWLREHQGLAAHRSILWYFSQRRTERCTSKPRFFFFFLAFFFFLVFHCLCSTSSKTTRIVQHWEDVMFRPAPMRKWQHFRAQKSWHDTTLSRKPFFCFSSLRAKQARRRWFGVHTGADDSISARLACNHEPRSMHSAISILIFTSIYCI